MFDLNPRNWFAPPPAPLIERKPSRIVMAADALAALTDAEFADIILARAEQMNPNALVQLGNKIGRAGWDRLDVEDL